MRTFKGLLRDLSDDSTHRRNLTKCLVLCHEVINLTQFLEKLKYRFIAIRLSKNDLHRLRLSKIGMSMRLDIPVMHKTTRLMPSLHMDVPVEHN
jgi:hypothetical protein